MALQLVHYHLGSQLANIRDIQRALRECARYYAELRELGVPIAGSMSAAASVSTTKAPIRARRAPPITRCRNTPTKWSPRSPISAPNAHLPHPNLISESGRALTAHHAVLLTNVIEIEEAPGAVAPPQPIADEPVILQDLWHGYRQYLASQRARSVSRRRALSQRSEKHVRTRATDLAQWARTEEIYFATCYKVREILRNNPGVHNEILDELNELLADKLFCNFSLFQSLPDAWAIDQIFPILPLNRLDHRPERRGILQDITCDSDGKIEKYVDGEGIEPTLPMPQLHR